MLIRLQQVVKDVRLVHGSKLWWLLLLMAFVALGEGLTMTLLLPLVSVLGVESSQGNGGVVEVFIDQVLTILGVKGSIFGILALITVAFAMQAAMFIGQTWWICSLQRIYGAYWQNKLFSSFMYAGWSFFTQHKTGELTNAITQETLRLSGIFMVFAQSSATLIVMIVYLVVSFFLSWEITLAMLVLAVALFIVIKGVNKNSFNIGAKISWLNSEQMVLLNEFVGGAKLIKATATENRATREINELTEQLRINHTWATFLPGLTKGVFEFGSIITLCAILVNAHLYLNTPASHMLLILALFVRLLPRFNALQQNIQLLNTFIPAYMEVNRLWEVASSKAETNFSKDDGPDPNGAMSIKVKSAGFKGTSILTDLDLEIPRAGYFGIVGESGAGKSTLVHLLLNLCELYEGDVKIGEKSITSSSPTHWRRAIGYVPQETILFHRSVKENIAWAYEHADQYEIVAAAKKAKAHDFILSLPDGYNTIIGDNGLRLSGGQRQRLGIARALITQPRFLLLDEATSALDSSSEQGVLETLKILRKELCIISIAHRLATVKNADKIIVMDAGSVVEVGNWDQLINKQGTFYQLAEKQHMV